MKDEDVRERSAGDEARETARAFSESAKQEYRGLMDEAKRGAQDAAHKGQQRAHEHAEEQREVAGQSAAAVASALHAGVEPLREQGQEAIARYWSAAADGVGELAERVKDKPVEALWEEAERYVREQPGVAFGGAMAVGFALSRFLKSSSPGAGYGGRGRATEPGPTAGAGRSTASTFAGG